MSIKIAILGNMNNNGFSLMRYFRDLGAESYLLLYKNDGQASLSHFRPECDTWDLEPWAPFIIQTDIPNSPIAALKFPASFFYFFFLKIKNLVSKNPYNLKPVSKKKILRILLDYDYFIVSGIAPAIFSRINLKCGIFFPYSGCVEFLGNAEFLNGLNSKNLIKQKIYHFVKERQIDGIRRARNVICGDIGVTKYELNKIGVKPHLLTLPMVYVKEDFCNLVPNQKLNPVAKIIENSSLSIFHHSRVMFKNKGKFTDDSWFLENKNTDWAINGFYSLIKNRPNLTASMIIVEYGPDVELAKALINSLGLTNRVFWLKKMPRRELMWILSKVSVSMGEFYSYQGMIWGGAGWEALASGKPLIQGFNFEDGEFESSYGMSPPPILPVRDEEDLLKHLLFVADNPEKAAKMGKDAKKWFEKYNGIELAKKWLNIVTQP